MRSAYEALLLSTSTSVCACLRSCMRDNLKLPAGCLDLFALEKHHLFDCKHVWKSFKAVELMAGRRSHLFIGSDDWLKRDNE